MRPDGDDPLRPGRRRRALGAGNARAGFGYFTERCSAEGRSKAVLTAMVGSDAGLSSERSYVRRTLPRGFLRGVGDALSREAGGPDALGDDRPSAC